MTKAKTDPGLAPFVAADYLVQASGSHPAPARERNRGQGPESHVVIYESTVYPGATEEDCVHVLEQHSGLQFNRDFHAGYSPERISDSMAGYVADQVVKLMTRRKNCGCSLSRPHGMAEVAANIDLNRRGGPPCRN